VEINLDCYKCNRTLDFSIGLSYNHQDVNILVTPCKECLKESFNEGKEEGWSENEVNITQDDLNDAVKEAFDNGYKKGLGDREEIL